jgi:hypothetical protein
MGLDERQEPDHGRRSTSARSTATAEVRTQYAAGVSPSESQEASIARTRDFFISYTGSDRTWAEWVAWQLEEAGYTTILQAWDFEAGSHCATRAAPCARPVAGSGSRFS